MALGRVSIRKWFCAYYPPIIEIPNSRYTPWRDRKRDENPYSNDEVESVAGQIYSFLPSSSARTRLACVIIRFVLPFAFQPTHYEVGSRWTIDNGSILLWHTFISRCNDILLGSSVYTRASGLHIISFIRFARSNASFPFVHNALGCIQLEVPAWCVFGNKIR